MSRNIPNIVIINNARTKYSKTNQLKGLARFAALLSDRVRCLVYMYAEALLIDVTHRLSCGGYTLSLAFNPSVCFVWGYRSPKWNFNYDTFTMNSAGAENFRLKRGINEIKLIWIFPRILWRTEELDKARRHCILKIFQVDTCHP